MKRCLMLLSLALPLSLAGQVQDNFADGDYTANPVWSGETSNFDINTNRLHLNAPAVASSAYLSTPSAAIHNASWEFYAEMGFATSSTNLTRIYLISDQADLKQSLNGYFVMIGNTADEVSLYRQTGTTITKIIDGQDLRVGAATVSVKVKVSRDAAGLWTLLVDVGNTGTYTQEAASVTDVSHTISNYLGVYCLYTATRSTLFWFDDFNVTGTPVPDMTPPSVLQVSATSASQVSITFSETVQMGSAQSTSNYQINNTNPSEAVLQPDNKTVLLTISTPLMNGLTFSTKVSGVTDLNGNAMPESTTQALYFVQYPVSEKDLIISEFMADQSPTVGLPETEFIEIHNRSANPVQLQDWKLTDGSSIATLPSHILLPGGYVVVTTTSAASSFTPSIGVSNFPSLNNTGDNIILKTNNFITIDSIHYALSWYADANKQDGGWSLEIIDPENTCGEETNWKASVNSNGGTPGSVNSIDTVNPDIAQPKILSITIESPTQIKIVFNERLDGNTTVLAQLNNGASASGIYYALNLREITIVLPNPLQTSTEYTLVVSNVFDCAGNALTQNSVELILPEAAWPNDITLNEILFNPEPGGVDFVEVYNRSNKFISLQNWSLANMSNGIPTNLRTQTSPIIMKPKSYFVFTVDSTIVKTQFPQAATSAFIQMAMPAMPDVSGTIALLDNTNAFIDSLTYSEQWHLGTKKEGVSLERMALYNTETMSSNWRSASESSGFATPGYLNTASLPFIISIAAPSSSTIDIQFNKPIDATTVGDTFHYAVQNTTISSASLLSDGKTIQVLLADNLINGLTYPIQVSGIRDLEGNRMLPADLTVRYFFQEPVFWKNVIITEVMADPTPAIGLPEAEYIEILNRSFNPIQLQNWILSDETTSAVLPDYIIMPGASLFLTTNAAKALFNSAIGVNNFPSLNNAGEKLVLKNDFGIVIDSIVYSAEWYHSEDKQEGGWSLEIVDPENLCEEEDNWTASESINGGTPGYVNSVNANNPDLTAPLIESALIESPTKIEVSFNEKLDGNELISATLEPAIGVASISYSTGLRQIEIVTSESIQPSTFYTLTLNNVFDCPGNALEANNVQLILPESALTGDLLLNEILFNPKSGGVDFVEVYNTSEKYLSLKKWSLANIDNDVAVNLKQLEGSLVIAPKSFLVFTSNPVTLKSHYSRTIEAVCITVTLPSLNDDEGSIALVDSLNNVMDFFFYQDDYHVAFLKDDEGVSLERVSLNAITNDANNWRSASQHENFATPGYKNSASTDGTAPADGEVQVEPEIFSPQSPPTDFTTINYKFDQSGKVVNAQILDHQGRLIKTLANNEVLGTDGFFRWDGDRDDGGRARAGYYVAWLEVFDSSGHVTTFRKRVVVSSR